MKMDIKGLTRKDLQKILEKEGFPKFSAVQIHDWLYRKRVEDFSEMSNLSKKLQLYLQNSFYISGLKSMKRKKSVDGTEKFLFRLKDGSFIESALIPEKRRNTLCISTQVGCKFKCVFCSSGRAGFKRNLDVSEIISQFLAVSDLIRPLKITNIVFMGVGEPLDNLDSVVRSIRIFMDNRGLYLGKRKICISTCGIIPGIYKLIDLGLGVSLSVSLHAADNQTRNKIMPINKKYPLSRLMGSIDKFIKEFRFPVMFEYIMIKDLNSSKKDAVNLSKLLSKIKCKLNLIPYNPSEYFSLQVPEPEYIEVFCSVLRENGIFYTLRKPRGQDINAACGQLQAEFAKGRHENR